MIKHFYKILSLVLFLLLSSQIVRAGEFLLRPAKVEVFLNPGETANRDLLIKNRSSEAMYFKVEIEDIQGAKDGKEPVLLLGKEKGPYSLKNYLFVAIESFSLEPGEEINLPVEINLPESIGSCGLYGAVLISGQTNSTSAEADLNLAGRAGALFFVKVEGTAEEAGKLESFKITDLSRFTKKGEAVFSILYRNYGAVHLNPYGVIEISNLFGKQIAQIEIDPYFVLPNSLRQREKSWQKDLGFGYYKANLVLNLGYQDLIEERVVSFWVLPFEGLIAIAVILLFIFGLLFLILTKRKLSKKAPLSILFFLFLSLSCIGFVKAQEMSSSNYKIQFDSINTEGGLVSTSNYRINDTIGESVSGVSDSTNYKIKAGYQQMQEVYISVAVPAGIAMSPSIKEQSGGVSNGSGGATVITDSQSGYILTLKASTAPALQIATDSFADYTPAAAGAPDFSWSIVDNTSEFGFTPEGSDIAQKFKDNGVVCNAGAGDTASACWYNLSTFEETIAQSTSANHSAGAVTTLRFRAHSGENHTQTAGNYQASLTLTALAN